LKWVRKPRSRKNRLKSIILNIVPINELIPIVIGKYKEYWLETRSLFELNGSRDWLELLLYIILF
jgi:hypothetical protein